MLAKHVFQIVVESDHDVINLRQSIRELGRTVGLSLIQQAKITTASSAIARGLLGTQQRVMFTVKIDEQNTREVLTVSCGSTHMHEAHEKAAIEHELHFDEARVLVDDAALTLGDHTFQIMLCMWIGTLQSRASGNTTNVR